jgi:Dihydrofolate reductase
VRLTSGKKWEVLFISMRKIIFESAMSIDGFIEGPHGELDWVIFEHEKCNASALLSRFDTIFYGRKAYEKFGIPRLNDQELPETQRQFYNTLNKMRKYVFTRTAKHVPGNGMVVSDNLEEEVRRIRGEDGKDIWLSGGADILRTFADLDLIDEYVLNVHPVVLKSGKPLFAGIKKQLNLKLLNKRNLQSGVVILRYRPESRLKMEYYDGRSVQNECERSGAS